GTPGSVGLAALAGGDLGGPLVDGRAGRADPAELELVGDDGEDEQASLDVLDETGEADGRGERARLGTQHTGGRAHRPRAQRALEAGGGQTGDGAVELGTLHR